MNAEGEDPFERPGTVFARLARRVEGLALCQDAAIDADWRGLARAWHDLSYDLGQLRPIDEVLSTDADIIEENFRLVFDGDTPFSRWLTEFYAWIRVIGLRRRVYQALGGFRPIPVIEDLEFVRRFERFGRACCIKDPLP